MFGKRLICGRFPRRPGAGLPEDRPRCSGWPGTQPIGGLEVRAVPFDQDQGGEGAEAAGQADAEHDRPVEQRPGSWSRGARHRARFLGLAREGDRGKHVDEDLEPEDLDRQKRLAEAGDGGDQDEAEHRHVSRNQEDEPLLHVGHQATSFAQALHESYERVIAENLHATDEVLRYYVMDLWGLSCQDAKTAFQRQAAAAASKK